MTEIQPTIYDEFAAFITSRPTLDQIAEYHLPDALDARVSYLLEGHRNGTLSPEEKREIDEYMVFEHLMRMAKVIAFEKLDQHELHSRTPAPSDP